MSQKTIISLTVAAMLIGASCVAQPKAISTQGDQPTLLVVGTAHLDTQWRWTIQKSITDYIPDTFRKNTRLMQQYPEYVFSFEGAFRYLLMKEYYPDEFELVRRFVDSGQWRVTGSWVDAVDVNVPSFEALVRHSLYGNGYFKQEFGKTSRDIFLPDCFGFGYALPSIANHCGLSCFTTQKLTWGSWVGIPFDVGVWKGVDGSSIIGAVNPGAYVSEIKGDLSRDTLWLNAARKQDSVSELPVAYRYFGTGDTGGSPDSASVDWLAKSIHSDGPLKVMSVGADDIVDIAASADRSKLPVWDDELIMTRHGVGCYTSQAAMKRWNRKNEQLADATERAAVIAQQLGAAAYPREMLRDAWIRFLWHQFHDDLTGTSIPEAYTFSWNDEILAQNRFAAVLTHAVETTVPALDTRVQGTPIVVYNPLSIERQDLVTVSVPQVGSTATSAVVYGPDGAEIPCDVLAVDPVWMTVRFLAAAPSVGYAVYDVRLAEGPCKLATGLSVSDRNLENERYRVQVNDQGEVASIYDKSAGQELLSAPIRYEFLEDSPNAWPAWEIDYDDIMSAPLEAFVGTPEITVVESGCTRVALRIVQRTALSTLTTTISLAAGEAGGKVQFDADIDWYDQQRLLKVAVSTTTANENVTYDLGLGVIERPTNTEKRYEVPGHQWADMMAPDGRYGVAVLNDCRYGWDHPTPEKLRLTLLHTPGIAGGWDWVGDEQSQDNGRHHLTFAVQGHSGDWREGQVVWEAARLNQPLQAFVTAPYDGPLGSTHSLLQVDGGGVGAGVMVNAVKLAEQSDEIVVRVRELLGQSQEGIALTFDRPILAARQVNGAEEAIGPAEVVDGKLAVSLTPYQPKAFAVTLAPMEVVAQEAVTVACVNLPYNLDGVSHDEARCDGDFDGHGYTLSGDLLPDTLVYLDVPFVFGSSTPGALNVVKCQGQDVSLPIGDYSHLQLLVASVDGPARDQFQVGSETTNLSIQDYADFIGQWDNRLADGVLHHERSQIAPAYINDMPVAWYGSHRHTSDCNNDPYRFTYLYLVELNVPTGSTSLGLPNNDRIRVMAATLVKKPYWPIHAGQPLYDEARNTLVNISADSSSFAGRSRVSMGSPIPDVSIHYTLDGSNPTATSAAYHGPLTVEHTTTVKASAFRSDYNSDYVAAKIVTKLSLRESVAVGELAPGLEGCYFEGEKWERLPGFDTLEVKASFVADSIGIPELARDEDYGLTFRGYVQIPADGVYEFTISSDDGSKLYISDTLLVDNDGLHGDGELAGLIGLKAGYHRIAVDMFQCKGGEALVVTIAGPTMKKQPIPEEMLRH